MDVAGELRVRIDPRCRPRRPGAVGHQVQQPAAVQVDQTGHPSGRRRRVARRTLVSSKPKAATLSRRAASSTSGVPWSPPPASRSPSQRRGHERPRPPRGRPCRPADSPERGLVGSAPPWDGSGPPAGPGAYPAGWLTAAPDPPLAPGSTTGQPPLGRSRTAPCAGGGARPAPLGPEVDRGGRGLDGEPPLAACDHRRRGPQAVQAEQPGRRRTPVVGPAGPPVLPTSHIRKIGEVPGAVQAAPTSPAAAHRPTLHDETPLDL